MKYPKQNKTKSRIFLWFSGIMLTLFIAGPFFQQQFFSAQNPYNVLENKMRTLNQILIHVNELYFEDVDMEQLMDGAFSGIMKELDPHSIYIPAKKNKKLLMNFFGGNFKESELNLIF